ncbi:hypothetical protein N8I77_003931 [Diaporthe amygdali]|uniref:JmjC domain-containing protein n=1 Tax=Phomopsis amygdali TaxID=1214568 RepID=A0AAD9SKZ3_PHOAM|nr:hypothetical protein N8I77_003931 [Diaporthe amygdali]
MAYLTGAAGAFIPQPHAAAEPFYSQAVFRTFDDDPSKSATPTATAFNPPPPAPAPALATHGSQSSTPPWPRPNVGRMSPINPSEVEMAEGLIQMRSGLVPMTVTPPAHYALTPAPAPAHPHETPIVNGHKPLLPTGQEAHLPAAPLSSSAAVPAPAPAPGPGPAPAPADHQTVSTSSDEPAGQHSDDFSLGDNSDTTITDPQVDRPEEFLGVPPQVGPAFIPGPAPSHERLSTAPPQPAVTNGSGPHRFDDVPREGTSLAPPMLQPPHPPSLAPRSRTQSPRSRPYDPSAPISPAPEPTVHGERCCCRAVPQSFLSTLDDGKSTNIEALAKLYGACRNDLCPWHLNLYAQLITSALEAAHSAAPAPVTPQPTADRTLQMDQPTFSFEETGTGTRWTAVPRRRRATSIPGIEEIELDLPPKRRRLSLEQQPISKIEAQSPSEYPEYWHRPQQSSSGCRPLPDRAYNEEFRRRVLVELAREFTDLKEDDWSRGETTNRYIHAILSKCEHPNTDVRKGPIDVGFLNAQEASTILEKGTERLPIITTEQQQFKWTGSERPIAQLFRRMEDLSRQVSVQIPSHNFDLPSYETKSLSAIRERFLRGQVSRDPWNILDLRSPLPPSILPSFLTGENCQLLPRIRDALLEGHCAERIKATREEWNEWTELLEWVLMSEGGHNTAPHMDSHGWSTWITIQEGNFGFGWLARPTDEEQEEWMNDPLNYTGGNWRFVILKPGQTVFFPSGTVHFVFRLQAEQTLALGGHLLQWTALERWVQIILWQLKNPNITNEDLGTAPLKYIRSARKLVEHRMANWRVTTMGGMSAVTRFMALATEVERWYSQKKKKKRAR